MLQSLSLMEVSVSSIAWGYGSSCLVGGLTHSRWERNNHSPGLLGPPDVEKVPKTLVSIINNKHIPFTPVRGLLSKRKDVAAVGGGGKRSEKK